MRRLAAVVLSTTFFISSAMAADMNSSALMPGKPAGVQRANLEGNGLLFFFGLAIVGGGIALVATQGSGNGITATTATSTATTTTATSTSRTATSTGTSP